MPIEEYPGQLVSVAIEPKDESQRQRLVESLGELAMGDRSLCVDSDPETNQTIISGSSEAHIENFVQRLLLELKVDATVGRLQVAYKETIRGTVEQEGKFVRQSGGRGQYGHVIIRLEPVNRGEGVLFRDEVKGGRIPREYIPAVEKGIREASTTGVMAGYPMVDFKVTLLDGSYHDVDSSELAFKIAGSMALKDAARKASPVLLEPVMAVEVVMPEEFMGDVMGDLSGRRGHIQAVEDRAGAKVITAKVPLKEMFGYSSALRLLTQGRASHTMELCEYIEAHASPDPDGDEPASMAMRVA